MELEEKVRGLKI